MEHINADDAIAFCPLTIDSCLNVRYYVDIKNARRKFREHERGVSNSSLLRSPETFQVLYISTYAQIKHEPIILEHQCVQCGS